MGIFEHQAKCFQFCYPTEVLYSHKEDTIIIFFKIRKLEVNNLPKVLQLMSELALLPRSD